VVLQAVDGCWNAALSPSVSTGGRDTVVRQVQWSAAIQTALYSDSLRGIARNARMSWFSSVVDEARI